MDVSRRAKLIAIVPSFALIFAVILLPLAYLYGLAFTNITTTPNVPVKFIGVDNFIALFSDANFINSLSFTLQLCLIVLPAELFLGLALALSLSPVKNRFVSSFVQIFAVLPVMITPVAVGIIWLLLFNPDFGLINYALLQVGIQGPIWTGEALSAKAAVMITDIWEWTPFFVLIFLAGMYSMPAEYTEAADVDGLTPWMKFRYILIPFLMPLILFAVTLRLVDVFKMFDIIFVLTYGGPGIATEALSFRIWKEALVFRNVGYACAMSLILLVIVILISNFLAARLRRRS